MKILRILLVACLLFGCEENKSQSEKVKKRSGRCSEGADCRACTSCSSCKHCSKQGGTCSVCVK